MYVLGSGKRARLRDFSALRCPGSVSNTTFSRSLYIVDGFNHSLYHSESEIVEAFKEYDARIVFGAETTCWPDRDLAEEYPKPANGGNFR